MNYEVVRIEYDDDEREGIEVYKGQIKLTLRRDKAAGDSDKNDYNRIHTNYVTLEDSPNYYVGKMMEMV